MYVTDNLVYLQLEKTGCSHTARLLSACVGGDQDGKHIRMNVDPGDRKVIGSIRNPWDWYVSLWAFGCSGNGAVFQRVASRPWEHKYQIKEWLITPPSRWIPKIAGELSKPIAEWRKLYADPNDPELFRSWLKMLLNGHRSKDIDETYAYSPISEFAGFQTFRYAFYFWKDLGALYNTKLLGNYDDFVSMDRKQNLLDGIIRSEFLEDDLVKNLALSGYELTDEQLAVIHAGKKKKTNTSKRKGVGHYYDQETIDLVSKKDRFIIETYDYRPPSLVY